MGDKAKGLRQQSHLLKVIAFVHTKVLWSVGAGHGPVNQAALDGFSVHLDVVPVGSGRAQAHRYAVDFREQRAFGAALGSIRGVRPGFSSVRGALVITPSMASQVQSIPLKASHSDKPAWQKPSSTHA